MKNPSKILFALLTAIMVACVSENDLDPPAVDDEIVMTDDDGGIDDPLSALNVSASFDYPTSKNVNLVLDAPDFLTGAAFSIYGKIGQQDSLSIAKGTFDSTGHFEKELTVAARMDSVLIYTNYIGLIDNVRLPIAGGTVTFDYSQYYQRDGSSGKGVATPKRQRFSQKNGHSFGIHCLLPIQKYYCSSRGQKPIEH